MIRAAAIPNILRYSITTIFSSPNLFFMNVPRLLKIADDKLAAKPMRAIYLPVRFCPEKMTPKRAP